MNLRKTFLSIVAMLLATAAYAQVQVQASIDAVTMLIGEQAHLTVSVTAKRGSKVQFPTYGETPCPFVPGVELLEVSSADTLQGDNNQTTVSKVFTLTSFDEHLYALSGMKVKVNGKTYQANQLALKVTTLDVDTLHPNQFFPPKDVQDNPFLWSEWKGLIVMSLIVLLLCLAIFYLVVRLKQNKPIITRVRIVRHVPAHKRALSAIEKLKTERMTTSEDQKSYYTQLTDTLRRYIEERFGFNAMEMTSSEIIQHLQAAGDRQMIDELRELFQTADLVKFAKYSTLINENDLNLVNAVNFIDKTKIEGDAPTEERIVAKPSDDEVKTRKNRITIKTLIWSCVVVAAVMLVYVVVHLVQLLY